MNGGNRIMITSEYIRTMARYNQWQNESIYGAAEGVGDAARRLDRGAFFGSIHQTLCHLLWGDMIWTSRFAGLEAPVEPSIKNSAGMIDDWSVLKQRRFRLDGEILLWADGLGEDNRDKNNAGQNSSGHIGFNNGLVEGDYSWFSAVTNANVSRPMGEILVHFFNHQTHHRGQVHAMLSAAGANPGDSDLFLMPDP
jgi:uncharacterized damage-inducible protein DinB